MKIGILVPVCSRNQPWKSYEDSFLYTTLLPSFESTKSQGYEYVFYIGVDDDDTLFLDARDRLPGRIVVLTDCQHAPARAWNVLCANAYDDGCDYMFQLADDVHIETPGWTERFIDKLQENRNIGVVGPCHPENYQGRIVNGNPFVIENAFVHKTHYEIFKTFYPHEIRNWFCDDWITRVYEGCLSHMFLDIVVRNLSIKVTEQRYTIANIDLTELLANGRRVLRDNTKGCFSFCLYGPYTDKYSRGLRENVDMIRQYYPTWDIRVYASPESEEFVQAIPGVTCIPTGLSGPVNTVYRFLPITENTYDVVCIRDTDSRIHERDRWCISTFLDSPSRIHTIRDHPYHRYRIMAGLWGVKRGHYFTSQDIESFCGSNPAVYGIDSHFLDRYLIRKNMVVYSYTSDGLFCDTSEKICVIQHPLPNRDFCGNVVLFREDGSAYNEFAQV